ncbi:ABC transporter permease [bacterium]|nr:ABC transporter permease [bacterium]
MKSTVPPMKSRNEGLVQRKYIHKRVLFKIAMSNLLHKKLRTMLTILGVVIGIGAIVFLVSIGLGLQKVVTERVIGSKSIKAIDVTSTKPQSVRITSETISRFRNYAHVTEVSKTYSFAGSIRYKSSLTDTVVYGADTAFLDLSGFRLEAGKKVNPSADNEIVVNTAFLKAIGISEASKAVNEKLSLVILKDKNQASRFPLDKDLEKELTVVAVIDSGNNSEVYTTESLFTNLGFTDYYQAKVLVDEKENVDQVRKQIESQAFNTASPADTLDQITQFFFVLNTFLAAFGSIGMIIAVLGMFNTLTIALLERTKEIGLLVSLGARRKDIRRLFVVESVVLSLLGTGLGIASAWALGGIINGVAVGLARSRGVKESFSVFFLPAWLILAGVVFAIVVALIVVAFPARRAGRISPIIALRRE